MNQSDNQTNGRQAAQLTRSRLLITLAIFTVLFLGIAHYLGNLLPDRVLLQVIRFTGSLTAFLLSAIGVSASYANGYVTVAGFLMNVNLECTALQYLALYSSGVVVMPGIGWRRKAVGLLAGNLAIVVLNAFRIAFIGVVGAVSPGLFDFVHTYLWQGIFTFAVLVIWLLWLNGPAIANRRSFRPITLFLASSVASLLLLGLILDHYASVLAAIAGTLLHVLPLGQSISTITKGNEIVFVHALQGRGYSIATDVMDSVLFLGLMASSWQPGQTRRLLRNMLIGITCIFIQHIVLSVMVGALIFTVGDPAMQSAYWIIRAVSIVVPIILWVLLRGRSE